MTFCICSQFQGFLPTAVVIEYSDYIESSPMSKIDVQGNIDLRKVQWLRYWSDGPVVERLPHNQ